MRKSIIPLAGVAVGGVLLAVVLAFVLFPPNLGGGDVPDAERVPVDVPILEARKPSKPLLNRPGNTRKPTVGSEDVVKGPNPIAAVGVERRSQPDAQAAGRASAPWSLVRRTLLDNDDPETKEILEEAATIISDLRQARRDPDSVDFAALETRQMALAKKLRDSRHGANPTVNGALDRLDSVYADYHQAVGE